MSLEISTITYLEQVKKVLPEWDITITPVDLMENPQKYNKMDIKLVNIKNKITRDASIPLFKPPPNALPPHHASVITINIASLAYKEEPEKEADLTQKIFNQLGTFYEIRKHGSDKCRCSCHKS